jgi:S1-C subfamily serine protease
MLSEAIITSPNERVFGKLIYIDKYTDVAVFAVPALSSRTPARFNRADSYEIGEPAIYSGFPGANSLLTFDGTLSGDGYGTDIAMSSFAWPGSSGSGVFNSKGEFVGVVTSIMVGGGPAGRQLVGSVVYVAPATLIDSAYLQQNLRKIRDGSNAGF